MNYKDIQNKIKRINIFNTLKEGDIMYNYNIDDEITKDVVSTYNSNKKKDKISELITKINQVGETFSTTDIPEFESPKFERLEKIDISDENIRKDAEGKLNDYKVQSLSGIDNEFENKRQTLNKNINDLTISNNNTKEKVSNYYENARENANNDALKRGLSRSSIVINKIDAFNKDELDTYKKIEKDYNDSLNELNFALNSLDQQKQKAINDFDIAYAIKLNDKISEINSDLAQKQAEIIKYNNQIAEKEQNYINKYNEFVNDIKNKNIDKDTKLIDLTAKYGDKVIEKYRSSKVNNLVDSYFKDLDKNEIIELLNSNDDLRIALGKDLDSIIQRYS